MNLAEIKQAIRERYKGDGYALAFEVRNQTGFHSAVNRYADALCLGLWSSHGYYLQGFEFKVSRSDVIKELTCPEKAREIQRYCHYWWLVVGDAKLVSVDELPASWGLMVPRGNSLIIKKAAPLQTPEQITYPLVGSLIRSCVRSATSDDVVDGKVKESVRIAVEQERHSHARVDAELQDLKQALRKFHEESGVEIRRWGGGNIGEAVKAITSGSFSGKVWRLEQMEQELRRLLDGVSAVKGIAECFDLEAAS